MSTLIGIEMNKTQIEQIVKTEFDTLTKNKTQEEDKANYTHLQTTKFVWLLVATTLIYNYHYNIGISAIIFASLSNAKEQFKYSKTNKFQIISNAKGCIKGIIIMSLFTIALILTSIIEYLYSHFILKNMLLIKFYITSAFHWIYLNPFTMVIGFICIMFALCVLLLVFEFITGFLYTATYYTFESNKKSIDTNPKN